MMEVKIISASHESHTKILVTGDTPKNNKHKKGHHDNRTFNKAG